MKDEKHIGLTASQLELSCFVVVSMQSDHWLLQPLLFIFFSIFCFIELLQLLFSYTNPSFNSASHLSVSHSQPFYSLFLPPNRLALLIMQLSSALHPPLVFLAQAASAACNLIRPISWWISPVWANSETPQRFGGERWSRLR